MNSFGTPLTILLLIDLLFLFAILGLQGWAIWGDNQLVRLAKFEDSYTSTYDYSSYYSPYTYSTSYSDTYAYTIISPEPYSTTTFRDLDGTPYFTETIYNYTKRATPRNVPSQPLPNPKPTAAPIVPPSVPLHVKSIPQPQQQQTPLGTPTLTRRHFEKRAETSFLKLVTTILAFDAIILTATIFRILNAIVFLFIYRTSSENPSLAKTWTKVFIAITAVCTLFLFIFAIALVGYIASNGTVGVLETPFLLFELLCTFFGIAEIILAVQLMRRLSYQEDDGAQISEYGSHSGKTTMLPSLQQQQQHPQDSATHALSYSAPTAAPAPQQSYSSSSPSSPPVNAYPTYQNNAQRVPPPSQSMPSGKKPLLPSLQNIPTPQIATKGADSQAPAPAIPQKGSSPPSHNHSTNLVQSWQASNMAPTSSSSQSHAAVVDPSEGERASSSITQGDITSTSSFQEGKATATASSMPMPTLYQAVPDGRGGMTLQPYTPPQQ